MIRKADINDLQPLAEMLRDLYMELMPAYAEDDLHVYRLEVMKHLTNPKDTVYIDDNGFFMVRDETEAMAPTLHRYNGMRVYIKPEHRKSSLLARFYNRLFKDFPDGDIMGVTEIHSEHIKVLDKRHELVAKVYRMNRRKHK